MAMQYHVFSSCVTIVYGPNKSLTHLFLIVSKEVTVSEIVYIDESKENK